MPCLIPVLPRAGEPLGARELADHACRAAHAARETGAGAVFFAVAPGAPADLPGERLETGALDAAPGGPPFLPPGSTAALAALARAGAPAGPLLLLNCRNPLLDADLLRRVLDAARASGAPLLFSVRPCRDHPAQAHAACFVDGACALHPLTPGAAWTEPFPRCRAATPHYPPHHLPDGEPREAGAAGGPERAVARVDAADLADLLRTLPGGADGAEPMALGFPAAQGAPSWLLRRGPDLLLVLPEAPGAALAGMRHELHDAQTALPLLPAGRAGARTLLRAPGAPAGFRPSLYLRLVPAPPDEHTYRAPCLPPGAPWQRRGGVLRDGAGAPITGRQGLPPLLEADGSLAVLASGRAAAPAAPLRAGKFEVFPLPAERSLLLDHPLDLLRLRLREDTP